MSSEILKNPLDYDEATTVINEYAWSDRLSLNLVDHAIDRMDERGICSDYLLETLRNGIVVDHREFKNKKGITTYRYRVLYKTRWGDTVAITIIPAKDELTVITEW